MFQYTEYLVIFFCDLAKLGTQVVVPYREEDEKRHLKVMGDLGQIVPMVRVFLLLILGHVSSRSGTMSAEELILLARLDI